MGYIIPCDIYNQIFVFQSSEELRDTVAHDSRIRILLDNDEDFPGVFIAGMLNRDRLEMCQDGRNGSA